MRELLDDPDMPAQSKLNYILRVAGNHRTGLIGNTVVHLGGPAVRHGPFAGMILDSQPIEGCYVPKVLGCYELELHGVIERIVAAAPAHVVNIGSGDGYYAVGMARRLPAARVSAYDIAAKMRDACGKLAETNGVADRISIAGAFTHADFATLDPADSVVICDIEGAELSLIDPASAPALAHLDILVEMHAATDRPEYRAFMARFAASHRAEVIHLSARDVSAYPELAALDHLDQLLSFWEFRSRPTPWVYLTANAREP